MTIYLVETVHRWRVDIEQWMDKCRNHTRVDYYIQIDDGENQKTIVKLYDKIKSDTDFIWDSKICEYVCIEYKNDPFLSRNVVNVSQREDK